MSTYLQALASYLPKLIVERANDGRLGGSEPVAEQFQAALLFADVSGFTKLTERLAAQGPAGTEHLTQILNLYFGRIIDIVEYWGGDVVKFAGDALIALWPVTPTQDGSCDAIAVVTKRATTCALELQRELHNYEVGDDLRLSMKISIGSGDVSCSHLGGVYDRWEFLVAGPPLEQVGIANGLASPGDVVVSPSAKECIGDCIAAEALADGAFRVTGPFASGAPAANGLDVLPVAAATLRRYIPGAIRTRLDANQTDWLGEQRRLSVIFMNLPTFNADTPVADADRAMKALQMALYRFEGSINKISVDDKGASLIAVLGLPPLGHVDDPERAVRAATAMRQGLTAAGHECAIGITTGLAFCGSIGNARRREYTVMGNIVNLAARLMQAAKAPGHGGLLCDEPTWTAAHRRLDFETLPPIQVKGRAAAVAIFRPVETEESDASTHKADADVPVPPIGRDAEMAMLSARLQSVKNGGKGGCVLIKAERGMGKARALHESTRLARVCGLSVRVGAGDSIDHHTPYRAWRSVFESHFQAALTGDDLTARRYGVLGALPDNPRLLKAAPLLEPVLSLGWEDNDETRNLAGAGRAERTRELLSAILLDAAATRPLVIILHDVQWIDSASAALLTRLAGQSASLLIVASFTPESGRDTPWLDELEHAGALQLLELAPLNDAAVIEVACFHLGLKTLPDLAARLIVERAEGTPLYAEEIALALRDDGLLKMDGDVAVWCGGSDLAAIKLPDTVEGLITARIDRLSPDEQLTIKVASVIGTHFESTTLSAIHPVHRDQSAVEGHCEVFDHALLTKRMRGGGSGAADGQLTYRFRSELLLKVIYNMMLFSQRRELHEVLAQKYERDGVAAAPDMANTMAYHWHRAAEDRTPHPKCAQKAVEYYRQSGRTAAAAAATGEAEKAFRNALNLLTQCPEGPEKTSVQIELQLGLGAMLMATNGWADSSVGEVFASARALCLASGRADLLFRTVRGQWQVAVGEAEYERARDLATDMLEIATRANDTSLKSEALRALGTTNFWSARFMEAREQLYAALALQPSVKGTEVSLVQDTEVAARGILAWANAFVGDVEGARKEAASAIALADAGLPPFTRAFAYGAAMWTALYLNDPTAASHAAVIARDLSLERGFDYLAVAGRVVHGWARAAGGDAGGFQETASAIGDWRKAGRSIGVPAFLLVQVRAALAVGDVQAARNTLADPFLISRLARETWLQANAARLRFEVEEAAGGTDAAATALAESDRLAHEHGALIFASRGT